MNSIDTEPCPSPKTEPCPSPKTVRVSFSHYFLFALLFLLIYACYQILEPYLHTIILAVIFSTVIYPIHKKILHRVRGKKNFAAFISCILLTLVVVLPLMAMFIAMIGEGVKSFHAISDWIAAKNYEALMDNSYVLKGIDLFHKYLPDFNKYLPDFNIQNFQLDQKLLQLSTTIAKSLINQGGSILGNITALIGKFFLMIFVFFFLIRDSDSLIEGLLHLSPLSMSQEEQIITKIKSVAQSALLGTLVTAAAQGTAGAIAFWISGLPGLFWGVMMAFASLIPLVGTALIWIPAALYLFLIGKWGFAIFMVLWCVIVVGMIDNFVRPLFMKGGAGMGTLLIFLAILGGINCFGLLGLLYGPLIFGLTMVFLYIYSLEFKEFLDHQDNN